MKLLLIDRDGTIIIEPQDTKQVNGLKQMSFLPNVISNLKKLYNNGFQIIVASNQDRLGTIYNTIENYEEINNKIIEILESEGIKIFDWLTCPHVPEDDCNCRKPKIGIVDKYIGKIDTEKSVMIGDRDTDVEFAKNLGIVGYQITDTFGWNEIANEILSRKAETSRKTKETEISVKINLDGTGKSEINTGLNFLNHMLDQIAKHGKFDLDIHCKGDLEVDEHHTIEDVAIALGEVYKKALGDKKGLERFASEKIVPLDEAISYVSIDISARPFCKFDAKFDREYCGDVPTEMISHFFQSFATSACVTLHIKIEGENTHHKIESCFKSFAKCLHDASRISGSGVVSTKGVL